MKLGAAAKKRLARAAQSEEARQALREANAAREATRLANMSSEQRQALREADAARHATRLANMSSEQRAEWDDQHVSANRARRGVTSLYQALQTRSYGECERRLLFDAHASGSAFLTVNSRRLKTLKPASKLHLQCAADVSADIERYCSVDITDHARMVRRFMDRAKAAHELHVCATCGLRDPSMQYTDAKPLHEIPSEHWVRIPEDAYSRLTKTGAQIQLLKRGRDGTFQRYDANGEDNQARVTVARAELHSCYESKDGASAGQAFHVVPEAVEEGGEGGPRIRLCKACQRGWSRSRGERVWPTPTPEADTGENRHCHDDLYWVGAPRNTVACGTDLGRLLRLKEHYGIDTTASRLEQLVLAEFRTHFVTFKVSTLLCFLLYSTLLYCTHATLLHSTLL